DHLDRRDLEPSPPAPLAVEQPCSLLAQQPRLLYLDARPRDLFAHHAPFGETLAERGARPGSLAHQGEGTLGGADQAHAVMQASRTKTRLRDHERGALVTDAIALGHADVLEQDLAMAARVVESVDLELPDDGDA